MGGGEQRDDLSWTFEASADGSDSAQPRTRRVRSDDWTSLRAGGPLSGSSAAAALTALGAHPIDVTVDRVLDSVYGETLSGSFMDASERDAFTQTFLRLFTDIAANAVRHTFRDHKGWVGPNDFTGDKIYAAVYKAVVLAHYYYFGFGRKSEHAALTHRLRPLIALIDHVAIPFALADGKSTLLCLAD